MRPALNGSSALQRFERSNASEIRNGIMFDFYPGLPHITYVYINWLTNITKLKTFFLSIGVCNHLIAILYCTCIHVMYSGNTFESKYSQSEYHLYCVCEHSL